MAGFYLGAIGDSLRAIGVAMVTDAGPQDHVEEAAEVVEIPAPTDFALSYRAAMVPCGNCGCPGCYDCTPGPDEPCVCAPGDGFDLSDEVGV